MKKKYLIVLADYYKDISNGLLKSALKKFQKEFDKDNSCTWSF